MDGEDPPCYNPARYRSRMVHVFMFTYISSIEDSGMAPRGASSLFNTALLATVMVSTCVASEIKAMEQGERKVDIAVIIISPQDSCVAHKIERRLKEGLGVSAYMRCLLGVSKIAASGAAGAVAGLAFKGWLEV